ncbi:tRNA lysidine(34) synthetase TilS [Microbulbifer harenosus]|uniref:tRNA(Ile)-lysidine synthase n=1 Tax=Microbulbifer harenosus TaxID=2576840 RepID=A0ABY2UJU8_9GAMM|nr:tRNA lysidine(34) synthetase TilS [Microbulbifer harenosus]TLM78433.1 tRNA lysidine(34) synthetase TilS [Microbulbifer harenosus]
MPERNATSQLPQRLANCLQRHPAQGCLWLGYSGGLDSTVLLHLLVCAKVPFTALHVHHGLSAHADEWLAHCKAVAGALGVPLTVCRVRVDRRDGGLEQAARNARYRAFEQHMAPGDQILLAHHADDQVETFLLRLVRGAGVRGLAAMAERRSLGDPSGMRSLLRPLLAASRAELERYALEQGLSWVEDDSNADLALTRNYLRRQVIPALSARWPIGERVARAADNLGEAAGLLGELAVEDLSRCDCRRETFGESIELAAFLSLSEARRRNLLRGWLARLGAKMPEAAHLQQALWQAQATEDAVPEAPLGDRVLRRYRDRLYLTPELHPLNRDSEGEWRWNGVSELRLLGGWTLRPGKDWPVGDYVVRFRAGGERAKPRERHHSQTLKRLLQEYRLVPWLRDRVPLIFQGGVLVAVGDLFVTAEGPAGPPQWRFSD